MTAPLPDGLVPRTWTDQPRIVTDFCIICAVSVGDRQVEVRALRDSNTTHYVTVGNLFGSQTFECQDAHNALRMLGEAHKKQLTRLPAGVRLVAPEEKTNG